MGKTVSTARIAETSNASIITPAEPSARAWPVPSSGLINIKGSEVADRNPIVLAKIINTAGALLQTINLANKFVTTTNIAVNGIYYIVLVNKDGSVRETKRIVIER